ncbi:hypothetical protein L596_030261 [Steinernema carpocapsae]|uniref:Carboxypeptidase n=1 Tax=Steinernema carpocapsae TaxID=34508 RepID=A0A4U5LS71_STECR|nr:hypothetical protein L596_030261 [Steinernema carpocapsae]
MQWFPLLFALLLPCSFALNYKEEWGYVSVRTKAHLFWWHYYTDDAERPLVLWLQGGPGASGVGFGNFEEIGPVDWHNRTRQHSWLAKADLLFIDYPVGTGFSYTTHPNGYTKNIDEICNDLLAFLKFWEPRHINATMQPFYIFSESYGGKVAAVFGDLLYKKVQSDEININFKGVVLGNSWISPVDYTAILNLTLHEDNLLMYKDVAKKCQDFVDQNSWSEATDYCEMAHNVLAMTGVDFYNIMGGNDIKQTGQDEFMNYDVRQKLRIIPESVHWTNISWKVADKHREDIMKPVIHHVDNLLSHENIKVVVFSGEWDLVCNVLGTLRWMSKLNWPHLNHFKKMDRKAFFTKSGQFVGYFKKLKNLEFYLVKKAGHMVPKDNPEAGIRMLEMILGQ